MSFYLSPYFLHYLGLIMCFIDDWPFVRSNNFQLTISSCFDFSEDE